MFTDLIDRTTQPDGWQKIPWHDSAFSRRMLAEHLDQTHDMASRRQEMIDAHVAWIDRKLLGGEPARVLDMGCGPGFYTARLAARGHTCTGIDISPASIEYARAHHPAGDYRLGDVRELDCGTGYNLVAMIYGELNAFAPEDAERIVARAHAALRPGGRLLLEVHRYTAIIGYGHQPPSWHTAPRGLFADEPYLCLIESRLDGDRAIAHHYVFDAQMGAMQHYIAMHQAYTDDEYRRLLGAFHRAMFYPSLSGAAEVADLFVIVAEK